MNKKYDLQRFITVQQNDYMTALNEIKRGRKTSHWMWYIFPQIYGLGQSPMSEYYGIKGLDEAIAYLEDPYLGDNLREICQALLELETNNATEVFGRPDDKKLKSSMTLFAHASNENSVFQDVLDKYFAGKFDGLTIYILNQNIEEVK